MLKALEYQLQNNPNPFCNFVFFDWYWIGVKTNVPRMQTSLLHLIFYDLSTPQTPIYITCIYGFGGDREHQIYDNTITQYMLSSWCVEQWLVKYTWRSIPIDVVALNTLDASFFTQGNHPFTWLYSISSSEKMWGNQNLTFL